MESVRRELEFGILGSLEVLAAGEPLVLGAPKERALLALLLIHRNEPVASERLVEELWAGRPPPRAVGALQVYVSHLRRLLEPGRGRTEDAAILQSRPHGYLLVVEEGRCDVDRFLRLYEQGTGELAGAPARAAARLREALAVWRGPALADFVYDQWAQAAIARLDELRLACLEQRIEADLALGRQGELVGELEALIGEHPLRERLRGQLMLALYRSGRQAEALEVYQETRHTLVEQLGIDPTPALQRLEKRILTQDLSLDLEPAPRQAAVAAQALSRSPERSVLVVPRDRRQLRELLRLGELLAGGTEPHELLIARLVDAEEVTEATAELERERRALSQRAVWSRVAAFTSADPGSDLVRLSARPEIDLLILAAHRTVLVDGQLRDDEMRVLTETPAHVGLWVKRDGFEVEGRGEAVVVPFSGSEHDWAAAEVAAWLATASGAELHLVGTTADSEAGRRDASRLLADAALLMQSASDVVPRPVLVPPGREGIVDASEGADLLVVGLSERWEQEGLGMLRWALAKTAPVPVLFVRRGLRPSGLAPAASVTRYTWSVSELRARSPA